MVLLAQTAAESQGAMVLGILGIIGAAAAGTYQRFTTAGVKADAQRLENAVHNWMDRCKQMEAANQTMVDRLIACERERVAWQTRYETLLSDGRKGPGADGTPGSSSPPS